MKIIGAIKADVQSDFFHSLGESEHIEVQQHAPADFDYANAINRIQAAELGLAQVPTNTAEIDDNAIIIGAHTDLLGGLSEFFEVDAQDEFTGKIQHGTRNYVEIENVRAVESAQTNPTDGMPRGFLVTTGYCTEKFQMLDDGRVELVQNAADPAVDPADGSTLAWTYQLGGQDGETDADRHLYDGLTFVHHRLDENGDARAEAQQPDYQHISLRATTDEASLYIRSDSKAANTNIVEFVHATRRRSKILCSRRRWRDADFQFGRGSCPIRTTV